MIDYSKFNMYLPLEDEITEDIFNSITAGIRYKDPDSMKNIDEELDALMKTNESVDTVLSDAMYSIEVYRILFKHSHKVGLDVTPYIYDIFIKHNYKHNFKLKIDQFIKDTPITSFTNDNVISFLNDFNKTIRVNIFHDLLNSIARRTNVLSDIREIAVYGLDNLNQLLLEHDIEKHATIKTLATFGGTLPQARELIERYLTVE